MKNTISTVTISDLGEKLQKIIGQKSGNTSENSGLAIIERKDMPQDEDFPLSKTSGMSMKDFNNLMKVTAQEFLGRPLNAADIDVVRATDMNDNSLSKDSKDTVDNNSVNTSRPKIR